MHNAAFQALRMDWAYLAFDVLPEKLQQALRALPALGMKGVNITIPHKEAAAGMVDELSSLANLLGAVNTVQVEGETLIGHNTDASGFLSALREAGVEPKGERVVLLGAGGAARAIAVALAEKKVKTLVVANRTVEKAVGLAERIKEINPEVQVAPFGLPDLALKEEVESAGLLVNATSVGMYPQVDVSAPIPTQWLHPGQTVVDIIYRPLLTSLLSEAKRRGCHTLNGVKMLVWQGAEAFSLWTGQPAPVEIMERALTEALEEKSSEQKNGEK